MPAPTFPVIFLAVLAPLAAPAVSRAADAGAPALKDVFAGKFLIGAALETDIVTNPSHPARALVARQFSSISPCNLLKWEPYNPEPDVYNEKPVEEFFALGEANHQFILAHNLFWHYQTPA